MVIEERDTFVLYLVLYVVLLMLCGITTAGSIVGNIEINRSTFIENGGLSEASGVQIIAVDLYPGENINLLINIQNTFYEERDLVVNITDEIRRFVFIKNPTAKLKPRERFKLNLTINIPIDTKSGMYSGILTIGLDSQRLEIPTNIRVLPPQEQLLNIEIRPIVTNIEPGKDILVYANIYNPKNVGRDVNLTIQLVEIASNNVLNETNLFQRVDKTTTLTGRLHIPENLGIGRYIVKGIIRYRGLGNRTEEVDDVDFIHVEKPFFNISLFGIPLWAYIGILFLLISISIILYVMRSKEKERRRYVEIIDFKSLPTHGERLAYIGKVAEHGMRVFFELDRLREHAIISGSTGVGKTVAAQDIVEEALMKDVSVLVFDPTAQWTGFLRPNREKGMLRLYKMFGMNEKSARGFNGSIKIVMPPIGEFDIKRYINPGEITIFCIDKLMPEDIELFIVEVVLSVFRERMEESTNLKVLLVFDEVHRLLPKFGGTGKGIIQLERACREFRKWGIGLILISQVFSDFPTDIVANVGTEIQLRTRYEGDLRRINTKYGEDTVKSVVKAKTGTGMIHNPHYNRGRPYFITFRPLLHNPRRLSDKELEMYSKYDRKLELLTTIVKNAKDKGIDVFDLEIELELALDNLKKGEFDIVDMYLESLEPRIKDLKV